METKEQSRREFISTLTLGTIGVAGAAGMLAGCKGIGVLGRLETNPALQLSDQAPDGPVLKAGLIGCGNRGRGAAINFLDAGPNLEIVAIGDLFQDQIDRTREILLQSRGMEIAEENCFIGFDCYQKVINAGVDVVLLASPPHFRPREVKAAVEAGKHIFLEKPVAVDPAGVRIISEQSEIAKQKQLCMVTGTIRRYQKDYIETQRRVAEGAIGDIVGANIMRHGNALWWVERKPGWTDMEYMIRNWGNFCWLSGDHIVDQFIHELDVMSWYLGSHPVKAIGNGGRHQRQSGDQFDHFSISFEYDNGLMAHGATRQINGLHTGKTERITGTKGFADASGSIYDNKGALVWEYPYPDDNDQDQTWRVQNPYLQEHVELVSAIRTGGYINDSDENITSTLISIMGRMAAYTGLEVSWDEVLNSNMRLGPETCKLGPVPGIVEAPPRVGIPSPPTDRYS